MFETFYVSSLYIIMFILLLSVIVLFLPEPFRAFVIKAFNKYMWDGVEDEEYSVSN